MKRILLFAAMACGGVNAQPSSMLLTAQDLHNRMTSTPIFAHGYIAGVADAQSGVTVCIPPGQVTLGQMADMVKQTLENLPSERHIAADIYVQLTLQKRWPCAKKGAGI